MKNSVIVIILAFLALGEARRSTRLANVLSKQHHHHSSKCVAIVSVLFQFLAIGRLTLGLLHVDAFCFVESHWFLGPGSADDENDLDAIKEVKDVDSAKEANDGDKKADTKLEITATHRRWRPFGSGFFADVAQSGIDADKK